MTMTTDPRIFQHLELDVTVDSHRLLMQVNDRQSQQDAALCSGQLWAVADGMGGHDRGADASHVALAALAAAVDGPADLETLAAAARQAHEAVVALATSTWRAPGTTLVAVTADLDGDRLNGIWCGDSRAYLWHAAGRLERLTVDHAGPSGGITHALGDHGPDAPPLFETFTVAAGHGHRLLLATDGITGPFDRTDDPTGTLAGILAQNGPDGLVTAARDRGSDNLTLVVLDVDRLATGTTPAPQLREPERSTELPTAEGARYFPGIVWDEHVEKLAADRLKLMSAKARSAHRQE